MQFGFYHRWFDVIFILSALASLVLILMQKTGTRLRYAQASASFLCSCCSLLTNRVPPNSEQHDTHKSSKEF